MNGQSHNRDAEYTRFIGLNEVDLAMSDQTEDKSEKKEDELPSVYEARVRDLVIQNAPLIEEMAKKLNVSPTAIAGFMAEEYDSIQKKPSLERVFFDFFADLWVTPAQTLVHSHNHYNSEYSDAIGHRGDYTKQMVEKPAPWEKIMNTMLRDVGPVNFNTRTAIGLVKDYIKWLHDLNPDNPYDNDFLGLAKYENNYDDLITDLARELAEPQGHGVTPIDVNGQLDFGPGEKPLTIALTGLITKEAENWFKSMDPNWDSYDQAFRDALVVTYANLGRVKIGEYYEKATQNDAPEIGSYSEPREPPNYGNQPYTPGPGKGTAGGESHLRNADYLRKAYDYGLGRIDRAPSFNPPPPDPNAPPIHRGGRPLGPFTPEELNRNLSSNGVPNRQSTGPRASGLPKPLAPNPVSFSPEDRTGLAGLTQNPQSSAGSNMRATSNRSGLSATTPKVIKTATSAKLAAPLDPGTAAGDALPTEEWMRLRNKALYRPTERDPGLTSDFDPRSPASDKLPIADWMRLRNSPNLQTAAQKSSRPSIDPNSPESDKLSIEEWMRLRNKALYGV